MITDLQVYTLHDALPTFLDINGQPVIGRIKFYEPDGTTYKAIYEDMNYTRELPNPLLTSLSGRPESQPFLKNGLYRVVVEKFIGDDYATMAQYQYEHEDPEHLGEVSHWEFEKEFLIDSGKIDAENTQLAYMATVNTIAELRTLSFDEYKYATVIDYDENVKGMAPRTYVWNASSIRTEDYGATIISSLSDSGRWELLETPILDSTTFGISPYVDSGILQSRLNGLANYSMANYRKAQVIYWKPGVYNLDNGSNISIGLPVVCYGNLKFMCNNGEARVSFQGGLEYNRTNNLNDINTTLVINQDVVHASWWAGLILSFNGNNTPFNTIIADNTTATSQVYSNLNVYVENPNGKITANNCNIRLDKNINSTGNIFYNCRFDQGVGQFTSAQQYFNGSMTIHPWMFTPGISVQGISIGRNIQYSCAEWGAQRFAELKLIQGYHSIGSIDEGTINITLPEASADLSDFYVIENGMGEIDLDNKAINLELHNFSGTLKNVVSPSHLNLVDCWITIEGYSIGTLELRRGSITHTGNALNVTGVLNIDNGNLNSAFTTTTNSTLASISNSTINGAIVCSSITLKNNYIYQPITGINIDLTGNQIYAQVEQTEANGVITVKCIDNMFHINPTTSEPARHYIHANYEGTVVNGVWSHNGSSYDTIHWIRLDRTNLKIQDNDHHYCYTGNSEPYLMKYSGLNHPMKLPVYAGSRYEGRGVFATSSIPFVFINKLTLQVTVVPRSIYWKCFSVGRNILARTGQVRCNWYNGILEGDYSEQHNGDITVIYNWGCDVLNHASIMDNQTFGYAFLVSRDGTGEAEYNVSFESESTDHTTSVFSNGVPIGYLDRSPYNGWDGVNFAVYPATPGSAFNIFVHMDPDFAAGSTTPQGYPT